MSSFSSSSIQFDLGNDVDMIINKMVNSKKDINSEFDETVLHECLCCLNEDIDNSYNFKKICGSCNNRLCIDCFETEMDQWIMNYNTDDCEFDITWLCLDCACLCSSCENYVNEYDINTLLDTNDEEQDLCHNCIFNGLNNCKMVSGRFVIDNCDSDEEYEDSEYEYDD